MSKGSIVIECAFPELDGERFSGAVLSYPILRDQKKPAAYLVQLWNQLLSDEKLHLANA